MSTSQIAVEGMPSRYAEDFAKGKSYICNITAVEFSRSRTYGIFTIKGTLPGEKYSLTEISSRKNVMDFGDKRVVESPIFPEEIAADLCREINADAGDNSFLGVFVCGPKGPSAEELRNAHARLDLFYDTCIHAGDMEWQRSGQIIMIPDLWKRAAVARGLDREWAGAIKPQMECPGCGSNVKPGVAVCIHCHCVIDRGKALALGMIPPDITPEKEVTKRS